MFARARAVIRAHTMHLRQCRTHCAHFTVVTHARRAQHSMNQNKPVPARAGQGDEEEGQREARREGRRIGRRQKQTNKPASTRINTFKSNHDRLHRRNAHTRIVDSFSLSPFLFSLWPALRQIVNTLRNKSVHYE